MTTSPNPTAAEALAAPVTFGYAGNEYTVLPTSEWTLDALENFENGRVLAMTREVLTGDSYTKLRANLKKVPELNSFMLAMQRAAGVSGN